MEYIYLTRHKRDQSVMVEKKRKKQILSLAAFEKRFGFGIKKTGLFVPSRKQKTKTRPTKN